MRIGIFGAGSIGCFCGGLLAAHGDQPVMVGRAQMGERLGGGFTITRFDGLRREAPAGSFVFEHRPEALSDCDSVLVCVKSGDTAAAGESLARVIREDTVVVSIQNGVRNAAILRSALGSRSVLPGMAAFNVAQVGPSRFHCGTEGGIVIGDGRGALQVAAALTLAGIATAVRRDIDAVQWGKLILNLNNAVNALSGLPLKRQLANRQWRRVLAASVREALGVLKAASIRPATPGKTPLRVIPAVLELPDWLFVRVAASMIRMDDEARSSMAEDLEKGRPPEIEELNGEIVRLAEASAIPAPVNRVIAAEVRKLFASRPRRHPGAGAILEAIRQR